MPDFGMAGKKSFLADRSKLVRSHPAPPPNGGREQCRTCFQAQIPYPIRIVNPNIKSTKTNQNLTMKRTNIIRHAINALKRLALASGVATITALVSNSTLAAIAQRGTATTANVAASASLTINKPSGVVAGDVMIVEIAQFYNGTAANATSTGWTLVKGGTIANANRYGTILYRLTDASDASVSSYTFTLNPGSVDLAIGAIMAFSGVDQANPLDVVGTGFTTANGTTVTGTGITTLSPNAAVIMFAMMAYTATPAPTWSVWTTATSPGTLAEIADYQAVLGTTRYVSVGAAWATKATAGATGNGTATVTPSSRNGGVLIALKAQDPSSKDFGIFGPGGLVNTTAATVAWMVPAGTDVTTLAPTFTHNGASVSPASGTQRNFTTPQTYTITAQDNTTKVYTVTVTVEPSALPVTNGLVVWLKANAVNTSDGTQIRTSGSDLFVQQWNDSSGASRNAANATQGDQPKYIASAINGRPAIRFTEDNNETGDRLYMGDQGANFPTAASAFIVAAPNELPAGGGYTLFDNESNDGRWWSGPSQYNESTPGTFRQNRDGTFNTTAVKAAWPYSGSHVYALESSSSVYRYVVDGSNIGGTVGVAQYHSGSGQTMTIGNRWQGGGGGSQLNGDIAELILFNRILTSDEANLIGNYLATKYAVNTTYIVPTPPTAPTGLTASGVAGAVNLSWNGSVGASTYNVQRSSASGSGYAQVGTSTGTTYADTTAALGTTYYYVVTATNSVGTSGISNEAGAARLASSGKSMLTFGSNISGSYAVINTGTDTIAWTVPAGNDVTTLAPVYTVSQNASGSPASGTQRDFTTPQTYTITAEDNSTQVYTVTVIVEPVVPVTNGLIVWLKAGAVNTSDSSHVRSSGGSLYVQKWVDSSGNGHNATNTTNTAEQPIYVAGGLNGKPVLRFTQVDDNSGSKTYLGDLSANFPTAASIFAVATINSDGRYNLFGGSGGDDRWVADTWGESHPAFFINPRANGSFAQSGWPTTGSHVFSMESSGSTTRGVVDGTQNGIDTAVTYASGSGQNFTIGNRVARGDDQQLNGDIAEVILFNRVLTTDEANAVGRYLADKYAVSTTYPLPAVTPAAPTGLTATPATGAVNLSWTASTGAATYNVERSATSGGGYTQIGTSTGTTYSDSTGTLGTTYYPKKENEKLAKARQVT